MAKTLLSLSCFLLLGLASSSPMERGSGNLCDICGKSPLSTTRIYNGRPAQLGEFPWRVFLHNKAERTNCGGTIISQNLVLTAAHCVPTVIKGQESNATMTIRAGTLSKSTAPQTFSVDGFAITAHNDYMRTETKVENDIALIRIPEPGFDFSVPNVGPNCLPYKFQQSIMSGTAYASGWGRVAPEENTDYMRTALVKVADVEECKRLMKQKNLKQRIHNKKLCLTSADPGICAGDSGGSIDYQVDGRFYAIGINSYIMKPCGDPNGMGFLQKVSAYLKWIEDNSGESFCTN